MAPRVRAPRNGVDGVDPNGASEPITYNGIHRVGDFKGDLSP